MKDAINKIIEEKRIIPPKQYKAPFLILITGEVGSGKSLVAQLLSKELSLYLINGDYIRSLILEIKPQEDITTNENRDLVNEVSIDEMLYCIKNNYSVVLDRNQSNQKGLDAIKRKCNLVPILIKIISSDTENIKRVEERNQKQDLRIEHYGHPETVSLVKSKEAYKRIKKIKKYDIPNTSYDYVLDTNVSLEELENNVKQIAIQIKRKI